MGCEPWRDAISAQADGEDPGIDPRLLDAHLASCPGCRAYAADVAATRMPLRLTAAAPVPDLSNQIVKANAVADRARPWAVVRLGLAAVAAQILSTALPELLLRDDSGITRHSTRHLGAFSIAYAVGLLVVVARPARARTMLPVAQVLAAAIVLGAVVDLLDGSTGLSAEVLHLPQLLSVFLLWAMAVPTPSRSAPGRLPLRLRRAAPHREREPGADSG